MTQKEFNAVFKEQVKQCEQTLCRKAKEYTNDSPDRLSAFKTAAIIQGSTPQKALAGMMAKHIISIYDMCFSCRENFDLAVWEEKITDSLNYLFLLKAIVKEEHDGLHVHEIQRHEQELVDGPGGRRGDAHDERDGDAHAEGGVLLFRHAHERADAHELHKDEILGDREMNTLILLQPPSWRPSRPDGG